MKTELYTEKLYYADSHLFSFTADVLQGVSLEDGRCTVILDRTAFFPEGGGQPADTGWIGDARVLDVHEKNGMIWMPSSACAGCRIIPVSMLFPAWFTKTSDMKTSAFIWVRSA